MSPTSTRPRINRPIASTGATSSSTSTSPFSFSKNKLTNYAKKCWMTTSTGNRQTGHESPLACSARAQSKQHAMWPVSPWTKVAFRASVRQTTQSDSLPTARSTSGPVSAGRGGRRGGAGGAGGGSGGVVRGSETPTSSTTSRSRGGSRLSRCEIQPRAGPSTRSLGTQCKAGWSEYCLAVTSTSGRTESPRRWQN